MACGIYKITNRKSGEFYIGLSHDIEKRWNGHRAQLLNGDHHAAAFQASFNAHGIEAFDFEVIQECVPEMLRAVELYWLGKLRPQLNSSMPTEFTARERSVEDIEEVLIKRSNEKSKSRIKKLAKDTGVPSVCRHCECRISGKEVCKTCGIWFTNICFECHDEIAHDILQPPGLNPEEAASFYKQAYDTRRQIRFRPKTLP